MRIIWKDNPLASVIELDDAERASLREKIKDADIIDENSIDSLMRDLSGQHAGDCICCPASCCKCLLEYLLGIDTTEGLGKYPGAHIRAAFGDATTIEEALESLRNYAPRDAAPEVMSRWKEQATSAYRWLLEYQAKRLRSDPWTK